MKKSMFLFGAVLAAGLLTTACSSDENSSEEQSIANKFDAQGNAYVNIAINTPSTRATRANEDYDHGIAAEYDVKDAVLVLFNGTNADEDNATFVSASEMDNHVAQGSSNIRISDKILFTQQINKGDANLAGASGLLAFLVVNHNGKFVVGTDHSLKINGSGTTFTGKFSELKALTLSEIGNTTTGLLMTNAPMSSKPGKSASPAGANITWLTEIKATDIYNSEADAYNGSNVVDIFVERAAAKVDVTATSASGTLIDGSVTYNKDGIKWSIENYNIDYYIERHLSNSYFGSSSVNLAPDNYRFADSQPVETGFTLYRTYWAEDPNMTATPDNTTSTKLTQPNLTSWNAITAAQYIAENTVNQNSLKQEYTTRVILAVPFNSGSDFYTTSWAGADVIVSAGDISSSIVTFVKTLPSYTTWKAAQSDGSYDITGGTVTNNANGSAEIASLTVSSGATAATAVLTEAVSKSQMSYFKDGMAYYKVLIKHFGDDETPLPATVSGTGYNDIYGSVEADRIRDFLGRYSVVRNNWYNINLQGIKHIGKPSVPDIPTDTPDDEIDSYLKVRINVLSWAKRTQSVQL